jgi:hypothetical protein
MPFVFIKDRIVNIKLHWLNLFGCFKLGHFITHEKYFFANNKYCQHPKTGLVQFLDQINHTKTGPWPFENRAGNHIAIQKPVYLSGIQMAKPRLSTTSITMV